jgi:23S rRNA (uracil1939-C5)-methyltransferase
MLELPITALSHAGEGIGRVDGRVIFVPFALPGETVQAEIVEDKRKFARARLVSVLAGAPERLTPRCPHHFTLDPPPGFDSDSLAMACGGCQLQHLAYPAQLIFKRQAVVEQLQRIGAFEQPPVRPALPSPSPFEYRNHVQFALAGTGRLGFRAAGSHRVVAIRECHILEPALAALFPRIEVEPQQAAELDAVSLRVGADDEALVLFESDAPPPEMSLDMALSAAMLRPDGTTMTLAGGDSVVMEVRGRAFRVSGGSFFQVNTAAAGLLVDLVLEGLALQGGEAVLDLYSGVGTRGAW